MTARFTYCILLVMCALQVQAQTRRPLPPSLERELQLRGGTRVMVFSDTLKAKTRIAASIRDTALEELDSTMVGDSAIVMTDSAVSIAHKLWLDASIAELPEYKVTDGRSRFFYPLSTLIDTRRRTIPFDSTLPQQMQAIERERLTASDALPLTKPISAKTPTRVLFNAGVGSVSMPYLEATAYPLSTPTVAMTVDLSLRNNSGDASAIRSIFAGSAAADFFFPLPHHRPDVLFPQLNLHAGHSQQSRIVRSISDSDAHSIGLTAIGAHCRVGEPTEWRLDASADARFFSNDVIEPLHESSAELGVGLRHEDASYAIGFDARYHGAGATDLNTDAAPYLATVGASLSFFTGAIEVGGGLAYGGSDDASQSRSGILPHAFFEWQQNPFLTFSASASRSYKLLTLDGLAKTNPFYSAILADTLSGASGDPRRIILEPLRIAAGVEYTVSLVERLSTEVRYIMSEDEPVFDLLTDSSSGHSYFIARPYDTRKFEAEANVAFLLFKGDEVNVSLLFASATITNEERAMPFVPTMKASLSYSMKALVPRFAPRIEFVHLARPDKSVSLLNAEASYKLSEHLGLFVRGENLFNAAGDYWTGYNEYPRNLMVGVKGTF